MKTCPVCKVDFDDPFSFCEFDGAPLEKVFQADSKLPGSRWFALAIRCLVILIAVLAMVLVFGKGGRKKVQVAAIKTPVINPAAPQPTDIPTPQGAQDYTEAVAQSQLPDQDQHQEAAKRPGVEVFNPEKMPTKEISSPPAKPEKEPASPNYQPVQPNPTKTRIGERTPIANRSESLESLPKKSERVPSSIESVPQPAPRLPQTIPPRATMGNESLPPRSVAGNVSLQLVRVRSYRTDSGIRYDLTFSMRDNGNSRMIRWERLSLVSRSNSGVTHAEAIPFHQRLGSSGALTFTVSKEMRGRMETDWQGQISCTGIGTDIEGRPVRSTFTARVNP